MSKNFNFYNGAFSSSILLAVLVIAAELYPPFKASLASIFSHHWIGKAVLVAAAFMIVGFAYRENKMFGIESGKAAWYSVLGSLLVIFLFFMLHYIIGG